MTKHQFRILYREFLFRMVDLELLSSHALGDSNNLLGRFAALLLFVSLLLAGGALGVSGKGKPAPNLVLSAWSIEHFLIATTMLVVGLFAVLSWDSTFPNRRDVFVLAPLPVRPRTLFLAKVAAAATALSLTIACLHGFAGLAWPMALGTQGTKEVNMPELGYLLAAPPISAAAVEEELKHDLAPWLSNDLGVSIGIITLNERRVFSLGTAQPDSIYQIASIGKTITGLLLAQMTVEGKVCLDEPVRDLLPAGTMPQQRGREIRLIDLATHRSGLPPVPHNLKVATPTAATNYLISDLFTALARHGLARPVNPPFIYSNFGFALLGQALAARAGTPYSDLIAQCITGPFGMRDTAIELTEEQQHRVIQAYNIRHEPRPPWQIGALAPAGAFYSTANDLTIYLEKQLAAASDALRLSHELRARTDSGTHIALAWFYDDDTGTYWHDGVLTGYTTHVLFNPHGRNAVVVLMNQPISLLVNSGVVARHIQQRLTGQPSISLGSIKVPASGGLLTVIRMFAVYWLIMLLSGAFAFGCVLALQGLAAQLLPRRIFLRTSSLLQLAAFCAILTAYVLEPNMALTEATGRGLLAWSPTYWFLGLFQQLIGSPALSGLASRAWIGLAIVLTTTSIVYALSYFRTLRKIAEEPDIVSGRRSGFRLPRFGNPLQTAMVHFSIRTLFRSRRHRLILAFYFGVALAFVILLIKVPVAFQKLGDARLTDPSGQVDAPILAASIALMVFAIVGTRVIFSLPLDLPANWIFRITGVRRAAECLKGTRRSLLLLSFAHVWLTTATICFWLWPWPAAAGHLAILAGLGILLTEICLYGFQKIPFTCSYLPGKSQVHLVVLGVLALFRLIVLGVTYELQLLDDLAHTITLAAGLALVAACVYWRTQASAGASKEEIDFEEVPEPAVRVLGLSGEGAWEVGRPAL